MVLWSHNTLFRGGGPHEWYLIYFLTLLTYQDLPCWGGRFINQVLPLHLNAVLFTGQILIG